MPFLRPGLPGRRLKVLRQPQIYGVNAEGWVHGEAGISGGQRIPIIVGEAGLGVTVAEEKVDTYVLVKHPAQTESPTRHTQTEVLDWGRC